MPHRETTEWPTQVHFDFPALGAGVSCKALPPRALRWRPPMPLGSRVWAQSGKVLRARSYADIDALDPGFYQNGYNVDVMNCIYSKLVRYKPGREWDIELEAAEEIEQVDDTHIRFKLKPGIMFTGGYGEMTAEDVKFSFERVIEHDSPVKGDWGPLRPVERDRTNTRASSC